MTGYLLVRAGGHRYGLRLDQVIEVVDGFDVSSAPNVHGSVRGVTRMREKSVPLVHLASLIANGPAPPDREDTAVLTRCMGSLVAFEVEDADAVAAADPAVVPDAWRLPWVCGVVREEETLVPVIDLDILGERLAAAGNRERE
jgi:chemotaxis signal transduction protein